MTIEKEQETQVRRQELKRFLRMCRERLSPNDFGFNSGSRRKTPGLRRDEVAQLANISLTTYMFLEQGRNVAVSAGVLESIASALRLTAAEHDYLFQLAVPPQARPQQPETELPLSLSNLLPYMSSCPAIVMNYRFEILGLNQAARLLWGLSGELDKLPNPLYKMFTSPNRRIFYRNWPEMAQHEAEYFRSIFAKHLGDERLTKLRDELLANSEEFADFWSNNRVMNADSLEKPVRISHPTLGDLDGHYVLLTPFGHGDTTILLFVPDPNTDSAKKIVSAVADFAVS